MPENLNFDDFVEWWPSDLVKYLIDDRFSIHGRLPLRRVRQMFTEHSMSLLALVGTQ